MEFHGYILIERPAALSVADWRTALTALQEVLNRQPQDPSPAKRLHYRLSNNGSKIIVEAVFDTDDISVNQLAQYITNALGGKYTVAQVRTALANNVTVWQLGQGWALSGDAARAYIAANPAEWG